MISEIQVYYDKRKPRLDFIAPYLSGRLISNCSRALTNRKLDKLGNLVINSPFGARENTLEELVESCIIISPDGTNLLRNNHKLLRKIANPTDLITGDHEIISNGREAVIIKSRAQLNGQDRSVAIKYQFATLSATDGDRVTFTPQIDAMRLAQAVQNAKPIPDLQYVVPMIATIDMSVSSFIEHAITQDWLEEIAFGKTSLKKLKIDKADKELLREIVEYDNTQENDHQRFLLNYFYYSHIASTGLTCWLKDNIKDSKLFPFELIHKGKYQFKEAERSNNKLISIPELYSLWQQWKNLNPEDIKLSEEELNEIFTYRAELYKPDIQNFSSQEIEEIRGKLTDKQQLFLERVKKTFYILELVIGSSKLQDIPSKHIDKIGLAMLNINRLLSRFRTSKN